MMQDVANVVGPGQTAALDPLFQSAESYITMWERARAFAGCGAGSSKCGGDTGPQRDVGGACGDVCPYSWNGGAPLQAIGELYSTCTPGAPIRLWKVGADTARLRTSADGALPAARVRIDVKHAQHGVSLRDQPGASDLKLQGDWAVLPIGPNQLWTCGNGALQTLACPPQANYVKVRRVLSATMGDIENCSWDPVPPEAGNTRVVFQCLVGPTEDRHWGKPP
jgi:hypothetical protein